MCFVDLIDLEIDRCKVAGPGIGTEIKLIPQIWLDGFPALQDYWADPVNNKPATLDGNIALNTTDYATAAWKTWKVENDKGRFVSNPAGEPGRSYYTSELTFYLPGNDPLAIFLLDENKNVPMICAWEDRTEAGQIRIMGNNKLGCFLAPTQDTGQKTGDEAGIEVKLVWINHPKAAPFYEGTF